MKCNVDIPYPEIPTLRKNPEVARMLMHAYAGEVSEDTAIHQYLFQSVILESENPEIAKILKNISRVEMHHLDILAHLIKELGVYPIYLDPVTDPHAFWNAKYVCYDTELYYLLKQDIESEKQAILGYNSLIHVIDDEIVKGILKRIVLDERLHLEIFEKLLQSLS